MNEYAMTMRDVDQALRKPATRAILEGLAGDEQQHGVVSILGQDAVILDGPEALLLEAIGGLIDAGVRVHRKDGATWQRITEAPAVPEIPEDDPEPLPDDWPRIDAEFAALCGSVSDEEDSTLRASILEHGCREALVVWQEREVLLDGHRRLGLCRELGKPWRVVEYSFPDRDAARNWIIDNALARRNLSEPRRRYLRGLRLLAEKRDPTATLRRGAAPLPHSEGAGETAERIAKREGVSRATVERDAEWARAVDAIGRTAGTQVRTAILAGEVRLCRAQARRAVEQGVRSLDELRAAARPAPAAHPDVVDGVERRAQALEREVLALVDARLGHDARPRLGALWRLPVAIDRLGAALPAAARGRVAGDTEGGGGGAFVGGSDFRTGGSPSDAHGRNKAWSK